MEAGAPIREPIPTTPSLDGDTAQSATTPHPLTDNADNHAIEPKKRVFVFLDGTWNEPTSNTHIWRLHSILAPVGNDGVKQVCFYQEGIGTGASDQIAGGVFALSLEHYIMSAYAWLILNYSDNDELFVFGFSRGAFVARSLVGLISRCGLLEPGSPLTIGQVLERYRRMTSSLPNRPMKLKQLKRLPLGSISVGEDFESHFIQKCSRCVNVHYMGIFDTVASVGIPVGTINIANVTTSGLSWNKIGISKRILRGRHALAVDEHRRHFRPTLWTVKKAKFYRKYHGDDDDLYRWSRFRYGHDIEQRWFVGAHSNIGGGYANDSLQQLPLKWIMDGAIAAGMAFKKHQPVTDDETLASSIVDSHSSFLYGAYKWIPVLGAPYYRTIGDTEPGLINMNEIIDKSVFVRWQGDESYRPRNIEQWAKERNVDLSGPPVHRNARTGLPIEDGEIHVQREYRSGSVPSNGLDNIDEIS